MTTTLSQVTSSRYVTRNPEIASGKPTITGTQVTVQDIVILWRSGINPEAIPETLYQLVTVAQVFDALSFYFDNQVEMDDLIAQEQAKALPNTSPAFKYNPLWDDLIENIATYRQEVDAEDEWLKAGSQAQ